MEKVPTVEDAAFARHTVVPCMMMTPSPVGGALLSIDSTSLLVTGIQSSAWMIPVTLSVLGIGLFVASRKSE